MGFGLSLPEFRDAFARGSGTAGAGSGAGFAGFFLGLLVSCGSTALKGPAAAILTGLGLADPSWRFAWDGLGPGAPGADTVFAAVAGVSLVGLVVTLTVRLQERGAGA